MSILGATSELKFRNVAGSGACSCRKESSTVLI